MVKTDYSAMARAAGHMSVAVRAPASRQPSPIGALIAVAAPSSLIVAYVSRLGSTPGSACGSPRMRQRASSGMGMELRM